MPRSMLLLRGGLGSADIFRVDSHSLIVTTPDGLIERPCSMVFRNIETHPFAVGETVKWPNVVITVLSVSPRGNPIETHFRFDEPLERAAEWWIMGETAFIKFPLPAVGESVHIPEGDLTKFTRAIVRSSLRLPE